MIRNTLHWSLLLLLTTITAPIFSAQETFAQETEEANWNSLPRDMENLIVELYQPHPIDDDIELFCRTAQSFFKQGYSVTRTSSKNHTNNYYSEIEIPIFCYDPLYNPMIRKAGVILLQPTKSESYNSKLKNLLSFSNNSKNEILEPQLFVKRNGIIINGTINQSPTAQILACALSVKGLLALFWHDKTKPQQKYIKFLTIDELSKNHLINLDDSVPCNYDRITETLKESENTKNNDTPFNPSKELLHHGIIITPQDNVAILTPSTINTKDSANATPKVIYLLPIHWIKTTAIPTTKPLSALENALRLKLPTIALKEYLASKRQSEKKEEKDDEITNRLLFLL